MKKLGFEKFERQVKRTAQSRQESVKYNLKFTDKNID